MTIFTRYMSGKFLGPFFFGLGVFALLIFLGDVFDKMHRLATSPASAGVIVQYLLLQMPYWTVRIVPMATLLAALFAVSGFVRSGEFVAVQASGFKVGDFFRPLLWLSAVIALGSFVAQETIQPASFARSQRLWMLEIHPERGAHQDAIFTVGQDKILTATQFLADRGRLERVVMDTYATGGLREQLDAVSARWSAGKGLWVFENGVRRRFDEKSGQIVKEDPFAEFDSPLDVEPKLLTQNKTSPDAMSFLQLREYVGRLEKLGQPAHRERTGMHAKLAYPFTNLILCALGIAVALRLRSASRPLVFAAALAVSFFYIWFIELGWYLGKSGRVPPLAATWIANICFGSLAAWMYGRADS